MADEPVEEVVAKPPKNTLVVVLLVLNLLTVAGTAAYFIMFGTQSASAAPKKEAEPPKPKLGPLLALAPLVANLAGAEAGDADHFLKLSASMEIKDEASIALVEASMIPIRDQLLMHLSSLKTTDVEGPAKRTVLQAKMLELTNKAVGTPGLVKRIFFTEFVVQ